MVLSSNHSWVLKVQTPTQKHTYRHIIHMITWQIHTTTTTLSLARGSIASSSFQPCVLNKHSDTDTQTKSNTDNPHLRARLLAKQKPEHKHQKTHRYKPEGQSRWNQLPITSYKHWHKEHNNTHIKTHRDLPEDQSQLPTASHGPCIRTPLFPKPGVDIDFILFN